MSKLETRLTRQLASKGNDDAKGMARALLLKRGHIKPDGSLTAEGKARQDLGNDGRAKDRAAKRTPGRKPSDFSYDPKTNAAKVKK